MQKCCRVPSLPVLIGHATMIAKLWQGVFSDKYFPPSTPSSGCLSFEFLIGCHRQSDCFSFIWTPPHVPPPEQRHEDISCSFACLSDVQLVKLKEKTVIICKVLEQDLKLYFVCLFDWKVTASCRCVCLCAHTLVSEFLSNNTYSQAALIFRLRL